MCPRFPRCPHPVSTAETCPAPIFSLTGVFRLLLACFVAQAPWTFPRGPLLDAVWRRIQRLGDKTRQQQPEDAGEAEDRGGTGLGGRHGVGAPGGAGAHKLGCRT